MTLTYFGRSRSRFWLRYSAGVHELSVDLHCVIAVLPSVILCVFHVFAPLTCAWSTTTTAANSIRVGLCLVVKHSSVYSQQGSVWSEEKARDTNTNQAIHSRADLWQVLRLQFLSLINHWRDIEQDSNKRVFVCLWCTQAASAAIEERERKRTNLLYETPFNVMDAVSSFSLQQRGHLARKFFTSVSLGMIVLWSAN